MAGVGCVDVIGDPAQNVGSATESRPSHSPPDDPLFIFLALSIRYYIPLLLCYELVFKNRAAFICCWPIVQAYETIAFGLGGVLGLV